MDIRQLTVTPLSLIDRNGYQCVEVSCICSSPFHGELRVTEETTLLHSIPISFSGGKSRVRVRVPEAAVERQVCWTLLDLTGQEMASVSGVWKKPRHWKLYLMVSSHTDIGLHNSPYIQRYNSEVFLDKAMELCDATADRAPENQYRYIMEGTWFWENYSKDRGEVAARRVVEEYILPGKIGVCGGVAGNCTQLYGLEEMCRSTYERKMLEERWGIKTKTMTMIDNNGMSWAMVQPYVEAGYENILFAPNQWGPIPSTVWPCDTTIPSWTWNTEAGGGGSRIDFRWTSELPQVFFWEGADQKSRLLLWGGGNYPSGMTVFGIYPTYEPTTQTLRQMEDCISRHLPVMEEKYPYDLWFSACYRDDQEPDLKLTNCITNWNETWQWPRFELVANPDKPFDELRSRFADQIPVVRGEMVGGWYQLALTTPEILADKFEADRKLPEAEIWSSLASALCPDYSYPAASFERAWNALLCNDEHSYGASGYQGRRVFETWMQHRAWIEYAANIAHSEKANALEALGKLIHGTNLVVWNPTLQSRSEWVSLENGHKAWIEDIPPLGYRTVKKEKFHAQPEAHACAAPPTIENRWYRIVFSPNGGMCSIQDKELDKELLDINAEWSANTFVYTNDRHKSFVAPQNANFTIRHTEESIEVTACMQESVSGADIRQTVKLLHYEKRIDIDNQLAHVRDLFNNKRYDRYAYYAFPFSISKARRLCHLNGCVAEYAKDLTGHTTDVYMPCREWCCIENGELGIGLIQLDGSLIEFDHIHTDKTDYGRVGEGSALFAYLANDWLQMHTPGGSHLDFHFRYAITSYAGDYQTAKLPQMAERLAAPVVLKQSVDVNGILPEKGSFASSQAGARLISLKRAQDGKGLIARLYSESSVESELFTVNEELFGNSRIQWQTVDERDCQPREGCQGFYTLRLHGKEITLRSEKQLDPLMVGSLYTGLIESPKAARGEYPGHLYLLWGKAADEDLWGYEIYRSPKAGFTPSESNLIATVEQEKYVVGRYEDTGLLEHTKYYYRVRALDRRGKAGPFSEEFSGITREELPE